MSDERRVDQDDLDDEISAVEAELAKATRKFGWQWGLTPAQRLAVIVEEVGEVGEVLNDAVNEQRLPDPVKLREELRQVAAMALKMLVTMEKE